MSKGKSVSIAICTYNKSQVLNLALESVSKLKSDGITVPVLVIDNNSTDNTVTIVESFRDKLTDLKYFFESNQGISHARNRAMTECKTDYLVHIDDDAQIHPNYIINLHRCINKTNADIIAGPIFPYFLNEKPEWYKDKYEIRIPKKDSGWMNKEAVSASNMVISKESFSLVGCFNALYGPAGNVLNYGEETDFIERARKLKLKVYFCLDLVVYHLVPEYKMNLLFFIASQYFSGQASYRIKNTVKDVPLGTILNHIDSTFESINLLIRKSEKLENDFIEEYAYDFNIIGQYTEYLRKAILKDTNNHSPLSVLQGLSKRSEKITLHKYFSLWFLLSKKLLKNLLHLKKN